MKLFKNKDKTFNIKNDANNYYKLDDFSFLLDQIINKYIIIIIKNYKIFIFIQINSFILIIIHYMIFFWK